VWGPSLRYSSESSSSGSGSSSDPNGTAVLFSMGSRIGPDIHDIVPSSHQFRDLIAKVWHTL
jgi:hypothetical protein